MPRTAGPAQMQSARPNEQPLLDTPPSVKSHGFCRKDKMKPPEERLNDIESLPSPSDPSVLPRSRADPRPYLPAPSSAPLRCLRGCRSFSSGAGRLPQEGRDGGSGGAAGPGRPLCHRALNRTWNGHRMSTRRKSPSRFAPGALAEQRPAGEGKP